MKAKINEIFCSIQGEGPFLGERQVFVRFWGCNLKCVWCDTPASRTQGRFKEYTPAQLLKKILPLTQDCQTISVTGGEPLLQADFLKEFFPLLKRRRLKIYLETNGICSAGLKKVLPYVDIIAMDIKLPTSTKQQPLWLEHLEFLSVARHKEFFIKAVISGPTRLADIARMVELIRSLDMGLTLVLQPSSQGYPAAVKKALAFQRYCLKYLADVRLIPQAHKILKIK